MQGVVVPVAEPTYELSIKKVTEPTPTSSDDEAERRTLPTTIAFGEGASKLITGGVMSEANE